LRSSTTVDLAPPLHQAQPAEMEMVHSLQPRLTASDVGLFNPITMPDHLPAMQFIDDFTDAVAYYGEDATRQVLRRCCASPIARTWLTSLDDVDRQALRCSTRDWERLIRRDFMPPKDIMEGIARAEKYNWTQDRTPAEYFTRKLALLRIAGIADQDQVVRELHRGFATAPQLYAHLNQYAIKKSGKNLSEYRSAMQNYQDAARLLYEEVFGVFGALKQPRRRADGLCGVTTPKPSECRTCHIAFPSRSRLHEHLRASGHTERRCRGNRGQPDSEIIETGSTTNKAIRKRYREAFGREPGGSMTSTPLGPEETTSSHSNRRQPEQYQHAFMGITVPSMARRPVATPLEPEKASEQSWCIDNAETVSSAADEIYIPTPPSLDRFNNNTGYEGVTFKERGYLQTPVSDRASLSFSFKLTAEPPSPHCSSVTLAETKTSTTRTSVPLPSQLPVRFSAILPATPAAPRLPAPPPATRRLAALELRFASMLMGRAMICRRIARQLIRWQVRPGRLKRRAK
jgi:hypothetical protein